MHKLAIIFLLGLLAFLLPFGASSMNVMAFEDYNYGYEADQYDERYTMDRMANGYNEDKYYNYYSNDNYEKSTKDIDTLKKIKCNNNNVNIDGDNTADFNIGNKGGLPTTADAEEGDLGANAFGEGYGSERNNGKFDPDCSINNNNNNEGGQGQVGPQGPQGLQGPSGITQLINGTNVYLVTNSASAPGGQSLQVTALCEPGDFVLNGGYSYSGSLVNPNMFVVFNEPLTNPSGGGWRTGVFETGGGIENSLTVHAYCFDNSP